MTAGFYPRLRIKLSTDHSLYYIRADIRNWDVTVTDVTHLGDVDHGAWHGLDSVSGGHWCWPPPSGRGPGGTRGKGAGAATWGHSLIHNRVPENTRILFPIISFYWCCVSIRGSWEQPSAFHIFTLFHYSPKVSRHTWSWVWMSWRAGRCGEEGAAYWQGPRLKSKSSPSSCSWHSQCVLIAPLWSPSYSPRLCVPPCCTFCSRLSFCGLF